MYDPERASAKANTLVMKYVLAEFRREDVVSDTDVRVHLRDCPNAQVTRLEGGDGFYGCDTGCESSKLEVEITCSHGVSFDYEYAQFGHLSDTLDGLAELEAQQEG